MKNRTCFMVEQEIWEDDEDHLLSVLSEKGIPCILHPFANFDPSLIQSITCPQIFCYGSLEWIQQVQNAEDDRLKTICTLPNFDCKVYYPHFKDFLFNKNHCFISLDNLIDRFDDILEDNEGQIFLRPSTGCKPGGLTGGVFNSTSFKEYIEFFQNLDGQTAFVMSPVKSIEYEWRTIIANGFCITGCQYRSFDWDTNRLGFDPAPDFPIRVQDKALEIISSVQWSPDEMYALDIVESEGELSVMEINALSTSGWYDCSVEFIIDSIVKNI